MATVRQIDAEPSLPTASDTPCARLEINGKFAQQEVDDEADASSRKMWNSEAAGVISKVMSKHWRMSQEDADMNSDDESDIEDKPSFKVVCEASCEPSTWPLRSPRVALLSRPSFLTNERKSEKFRHLSTDSNFGLSDRQLRAASTADSHIFRQQLDSDQHSLHSERDSNYGLSDVQLQSSASVADEEAAEPETFSHMDSDTPQRAAQDSNFGLSDRQFFAASMTDANVFRQQLDSDQHSQRSERDSSYGLSDGQLHDTSECCASQSALGLPPMCCLYEEEERMDSWSAITPSLPDEELTEESSELVEEVMELNYDSGVQVVLSQSFHGDHADLQGGGCPSLLVIPAATSENKSPSTCARDTETDTERRTLSSEVKPRSNKQQVLSTRVVPSRTAVGFMSRWRLCLCAPAARGSSGRISF